MLDPKNEKLSARAPKSSVRQRSKDSSLSKTTKPATTDRPSELIDIEVFDYWVDNLDCSVQESFLAFASDNYSLIEVFLYSRFLGYNGSIVACEAWVKSKYTKPDHRKTLLYEIEEMQEDIRKLRASMETKGEGNVKRDHGVARIAGMQRELRGTIAQVEEFTSVKDRKGLLMAGADRAMREVAFIFKDDPIETPLEEAIMSVWARMQLEE
jgi:hypothetical protein